MELSKGPISVVEIVFTLIGLGIIITVVFVVITNCCIDFKRRRHQNYDMTDSVSGKTFLRKDSVSYHPPGTRFPIQRTRSTSVDYTARTAAQEDLQYLQKLSASDDVFADSDAESNSSEPKRKISMRREQINNEIEGKVQDINRNNLKQTVSPSREKRKRLQRSVSFDDQVSNKDDVKEKEESVALLPTPRNQLQRSCMLNVTTEHEEAVLHTYHETEI